MLRKIFLVSALGLGAIGSVSAATQGTLGDTSTGTVDIRLNINPEVQITQLQDITLNSTTPIADLTGNTTACVYSNTESNKYDVTVTGDGVTTPYAVTNTTGDEVTYTAKWTDGSGSPATAITNGTPLVNQTGSSTTDCTSGNASNFEVNFSAAAITGKPDGGYLGTATILITPY